MNKVSVRLVTVATIMIIIIMIIIEKIPPVILTFQCMDVGERKQVLETISQGEACRIPSKEGSTTKNDSISNIKEKRNKQKRYD